MPVDHYDIDAFGFRVKGDRILAYSGDSGPSEALAELARDADLLSARRRSRTTATTVPTAVTSRPRRQTGRRRDARALRVLLTHRPVERAAPAGVELAYDGLELEF